MNHPAFYFDEPEPKRGAWRTVCLDCEWQDLLVVSYQDECEITECPECGSEHIEDVNEGDYV